jgi:hypothetical protein
MRSLLCYQRLCVRNVIPGLSLALLILFAAAMARATVYYVSPTGNDANNGLTPQTAQQHIQTALNTATSGDQVRVSAGAGSSAVYYEHVFISAGKQLYGGYNADFSVNDPNAYQTVIDGSGTGYTVSHGGTVVTPHRVIDGFTIQNGSYGLLLPNTDITISRCVVQNNVGTYTSGISASNGNLTVINSIIRNNGGGGINAQNMLSTTVTNCTVTGNGNLQSESGGIYNTVGTVTISGCIFSGNTASNGGGIWCSQCPTVTITSCTVNGNNASGGGGIRVGYCSNLTIQGLTIQNNTATYAGGLTVNNSSGLISNTQITGNSSTTAGGLNITACTSLLAENNTISGNTGGCSGGANLDTSQIDMTGNTITGNFGGANGFNDAGGVYVTDCTGAIAFNLFANNASYGYGGGVRVESASVQVINNTFTGNTAAANGGGIEWDGGAGVIANNLFAHNTAQYGAGVTLAYEPDATFVNNTVVDNTATLAIGGINIYESNPTITNDIIAFNIGGGLSSYMAGQGVLSNNCVYGNTGSDYASVTPGQNDITKDPQFVNRATGDYRLLVISPCIDAGNDAAVDPTWTDLAGLPRIHGLHVDIGAYEFQGAPRIVATGKITRSGSDLFVDVTLTNTGTATAQSVQITAASLGTKTSSGLPLATPNLDAGATQTLTHALHFNAADFPSGARTQLSIAGSYNGGTFSSALRITLP